MCTSPWSCFTEAGRTNWDLTRLQVQLSLQQRFTWKSIILVFSSPQKNYSSANAMHISICTEPEWIRGELQKNPSSSFLLLLDCLISRQSTGTIFFQFYAEVLLWLPVISLAVNSSTNFSGRRAVS